ncbi:MAG: thiamine phosphate synthase [Acutalibacteraceae bacterium]|nr:thiamine phosphate synthase [Acutalibacteraceae bacterium]
MKLSKDDLLLYAITDRGSLDKKVFFEKIEEALQGGVTILQLREKELDEDSFTDEAIEVKSLCRKYGVPLIINDNVNVALKSGADGVHVGIEDMPIDEIRRKTPDSFIIGATCKTVEQAQSAERLGADYMGVGAVFPSPTKKNAVRITREQLKEICSSVSIPAVAIGGITLENAGELKGGGMSGIAVVSAVFSADDIQKAASLLKEKAKSLI